MLSYSSGIIAKDLFFVKHNQLSQNVKENIEIS